MKAARLYSGILVISVSLILMLPESTGNTPAIEFNKVLLPAPLPPITVVKSPDSSRRLTPWRAVFSLTVPLKNVLTKSLTSSIWFPPYRLCHLALNVGNANAMATKMAVNNFKSFGGIPK